MAIQAILRSIPATSGAALPVVVSALFHKTVRGFFTLLSIMNARQSYDTAVKHLFRLQCQNMIPDHIRVSIPKSSRHRWKNESSDKYIGTELNQICQQKLRTLQQFAADRNAQKAFLAYMRLIIVCKQILVNAGVWHKTLFDQKEKVVQIMHRIKDVIPVSKTLKILSIPRSTYQLWWTKVRFPCSSSPFSLCRKRYIHQLLPREYAKMEELLLDPQYAHWPVCSIAHYARRNNILTAGLPTWYLYAKMLGIKKRTIPNPKKNRAGLKSVFPNQFWHADVTLYDTTDGIRHYIYLVIDNFSRKILAWKADTKISANIRMLTLKEAWTQILNTVGETRNITLITYGGTENVNAAIDRFLEQQNGSIQRKIALKEITFSNSAIEAVNKVLKYRYLFSKTCTSDDLEKLLQNSIHDYNHIRPHGSLNGQTPDEAYSSVPPDNIKALVEDAKKERMEKNRAFNCKVCG